MSSPSNKVDTVQESDAESHFALPKSPRVSEIKQSPSSGSLSSQRSVPKRRAAYKAAARIRRIAKQEAESDTESLESQKSVSTEDLRPVVCTRAYRTPEVEPSNEILTIPQTFLLCALLLLAFVEMTNWLSPCSCM
jgi:hypothetical protein